MSSGQSSIRRQIQLPFMKAVEISLKSIRIRFWRSMITAGGIFLGIAFYSSVQMSGIFSDVHDQIVRETRAKVEAGIIKSTPEISRMLSEANVKPEDEQGAKNRLRWLTIMGLLVCTVGITNAMLMSVTERYKEIGTMKCLGALDSLIVKLFFIESCLLGFFASLVGFILGWLVISLVNLVTIGPEAFGLRFWSSSVVLLGISAGIGTLLTFLATIAPAIRAAQMPPAAALRVEI